MSILQATLCTNNRDVKRLFYNFFTRYDSFIHWNIQKLSDLFPTFQFFIRVFHRTSVFCAKLFPAEHLLKGISPKGKIPYKLKVRHYLSFFFSSFPFFIFAPPSASH